MLELCQGLLTLRDPVTRLHPGMARQPFEASEADEDEQGARRDHQERSGEVDAPSAVLQGVDLR